MNQTTIFDFIYPKYKITKPIRLIELFAGYGSQYLALKYLGANVKHYKICEWATKSIQAYNDLHIQDYFDYSGDLSDDNILKVLIELGVSINYNEPATREQLKRQDFRKIYNNIIATNNLVNIQNAKGEDFKIVDKDQYDYIMTYSFPCQDLSLAGKGKGMADTSTRSGMLWEVERILNELKTTNSLPQILLMENVPQVHGSDNVEHFNKWQLALEKLGYKSYFQDLIATDYGIPQTRNRCFMVSILGDYSYSFPQKIPLKLKLKDLLEDKVDEKYFLSDAMLKYMQTTSSGGISRKEMFERNFKDGDIRELAATITTNNGQRASDTFVLTKNTENYIEWEDGKNIQMNCRTWKDDKVIATLNTGGETKILIKNATKKGYLEATDGDGINLSNRMEHQRGNVQKDKIQTLTTSGGNDRGVCVGTYQYAKSDKFMNGKDRLQLDKDTSDTLQTTPKEGIVMIGNYSKSNHNASRIVDKNYSAPTVMENHGTITAIQSNDLRIRKLSPRECGRLMNVKDEDITNMLKNQSNSSAYHCFGDSICTNVLMAIFGELLDVNWIEKFKEIENKFIDK